MNVPHPTLWPQWLLVVGLQAVIIVAVAAAAERLTRSAGWRRAIWQAAVLGLGLMVVVELLGVGRGFGTCASTWVHRLVASDAVPAQSLFEKPVRGSIADPPVLSGDPPDRTGGAPTTTPDANPAVKTTPFPGVGSPTGAGGSPAPPVPQRGSGAAPAPAAAAPLAVSTADNSATPALDFDWVKWLPGLVWFLGFAGLAGRALFGRLLLTAFHLRCERCGNSTLEPRVRRLAELLGLRRRIHLLRSPRLPSPIAFGVLRPAIGLPARFADDFDSAQQDAMLAHELAHLAAHDPAWHLGADLVVAALWWHPLAWWARRQFLHASEAAADEACLLVHDGQHALADSLVQIASRLAASPQPAGWIGIEGRHFKSGLGQRVQRLLNMTGQPWHPPGRLPWRLVRIAGPVALAATAVLCTAWAVPHHFNQPTRHPPETIMKTLQTSWQRSAAALAVATLFAADSSQTLAADALPREIGTPDSVPILAAPKRNELAAIGAEVSPAAPAVPANPPPPAKGVSSGTQAIRDKLARTVLDTVFYENLPLSEVVRNLVDESVKRDPEKLGINFLYHRMAALRPTSDQASGMPQEVLESVDLKAIAVRVSPPLKNIRMSDMLKVLSKAAELPVGFTVTDYAVIVSPAQTPAAQNAFLSALTINGTPAAQSLKAKLESIVLDEVMYDNLPLGEIVRSLHDQAAQRDPAKVGVNFLFSSRTADPPAKVDPGTGLPVVAQGAVDLQSIAVQIVPRLKRVRLIDVLDAITKAAERPIHCTIEDYAVVLSLASENVEETKPKKKDDTGGGPAVMTSVRVFQVDTARFASGLSKTFGLSAKSAPSLSAEDFQPLLAKLSVAWPADGLFYNPRTQLLMMRAPAAALDVVEAAIVTLGGKTVTPSGLSAGTAAEAETTPAKWKFTVLGQVNRPGVLEVVRGESLNVAQAIAMAGGVTRMGNLKMVTVARVSGETNQVFSLDVKAMTEQKDSKLFEIFAGDIVTVGERFY
ncbi:MAG: SLBB domain-containing protein [Verrucomicrobia bacterium]|nr:SLBB domain-containing protein [Verrucomicrobiota bacterium]